MNGIASLRDEGLLPSNPRDKAQILNKQFQSVFTPESALPLSALAQSILPSPYPDMPEIQVNEPGILTTKLKGALYRIWCGVNRLGDNGVKVV